MHHAYTRVTFILVTKCQKRFTIKQEKRGVLSDENTLSPNCHAISEYVLELSQNILKRDQNGNCCEFSSLACSSCRSVKHKRL